MTATRDAAFALVSAVLDRHRPLEDALDSLTGLDARDKAAGHRIAATVLRRLGTLDAVLEPYLKREPPPPVRHILRIGAASLLLLQTPAHAAVATAVALARDQKLTPFTGLVNAVLRRIATAGESALADLDGPRLDTPGWLWSAWGVSARAIAEAHQHEAPLDLSLTPDATPPSAAELLPTGSWRLPAGTRVAELPGYAVGGFWVQDAAAALPAIVLAPGPRERIADLCAAPGGKTAQLASAGAHVIAVEQNVGRLARLRENIGRLRLDVEIVNADAVHWRPADPLDAVLLDAPCSATGTIRRHPDVPYLKRPRDIAALVALQDELIAAACAMLRPGGRMVFAVCSLLPEEGSARIAHALARLPLRLDPIFLPALPEAVTPDGCLRTTPAFWPERGGMDGFFAARLIRD